MKSPPPPARTLQRKGQRAKLHPAKTNVVTRNAKWPKTLPSSLVRTGDCNLSRAEIKTPWAPPGKFLENPSGVDTAGWNRRGWRLLRSDNVNSRCVAARSGESFIAGEKRACQCFGQSDIQCVIGRQQTSQRPDSWEQGPVRVAFDWQK